MGLKAATCPIHRVDNGCMTSLAEVQLEILHGSRRSRGVLRGVLGRAGGRAGRVLAFEGGAGACGGPPRRRVTRAPEFSGARVTRERRGVTEGHELLDQQAHDLVDGGVRVERHRHAGLIRREKFQCG